MIPYAKGRSFPKLTVHVYLFMYYFQASEPASLPPPVSFSPPNAPPISAPEGPILQLTIPQSDPLGPIHLKYVYKLFVNIELESPYETLLLILTPSSKVLNFIMKRIGQNSSSLIISQSGSTSTIVGSQ